MSGGKELNALIDLIYEAVLNSDLWPSVLVKLADVLGAAQIAMPSADRRSNIVTTIAPRFDPDLLASFKEYWAFRDPVFGRAILRPAGEIYTLDSLMPREKFAATPVFNELWRPARWGFATAGASLVAGDQFSALICISNAPGKELTKESCVSSKPLRGTSPGCPHKSPALAIRFGPARSRGQLVRYSCSIA